MVCSNCKNEVNVEFCYCKICGQKIEEITNENQVDEQEKLDAKIIFKIVCSSLISALIIMTAHNTSISRLR